MAVHGDDRATSTAQPKASPSAPILREAFTFATFEPGVYEVVETFAPC